MFVPGNKYINQQLKIPLIDVGKRELDWEESMVWSEWQGMYLYNTYHLEIVEECVEGEAV